MNNRKPYIEIWRELIRDKSMIFLAVPRQAGKTTLNRIVSCVPLRIVVISTGCRFSSGVSLFLVFFRGQERLHGRFKKSGRFIVPFGIWDDPRIKDAPARFENMVAVELWRAATKWNDMGFGSFSLHFN